MNHAKSRPQVNRPKQKDRAQRGKREGDHRGSRHDGASRPRRSRNPLLPSAGIRQRSGTFSVRDSLGGTGPPFHCAPRRALLNPQHTPSFDHSGQWDRLAQTADEFDNPFHITVASDHRHRDTASSLIQRRYAWRGYSVAPLEEAACRSRHPVGLHRRQHDRDHHRLGRRRRRPVRRPALSRRGRRPAPGRAKALRIHQARGRRFGALADACSARSSTSPAST